MHSNKMSFGFIVTLNLQRECIVHQIKIKINLLKKIKNKKHLSAHNMKLQRDR